MTRLRFSIASLLGLVLFLAISLAALREATDVWDSAVFTTTLALLLVSVLLAVHRTERRRAFWFGLAVFGWVALVASLVPHVESRLLTTKLLAYLDSKLAGRSESERLELYLRRLMMAQQALARQVARVRVRSGTGQKDVTLKGDLWARSLFAGANGTSENFMRIGHSLFALLLAFLGGHISRYFYGSNQHTQSRDSIVPSHAGIA